MIFSQLLRVLKARYKLLVLILAITLGTAAAVSLLSTKKYVASASMVVEIPSNDPVSGTANFLNGTIAGMLATQVDLIKSDRVVQKVIDKLQLDKDPATLEAWKKAGSRGDFRHWIGEGLLTNLSVEAARESNFVNLSYESPDPTAAAQTANAFAQAYLEATLELKTEPAKNYAALFESQAKQNRATLEAAQAKLAKFQQQSGIVATDERVDVETTRLQELSSQLVQLQGLATEAQARQNAGNRAGRDSMPEVTANPTIQALKTQLAQVEALYQQQSAQYGPKHPAILATEAQMKGLRAQIAEETARVAGSVAQGSMVNSARENEVRALFEAQRNKVLQLRQQRDQLALLQRDVDAAQRAYDLLSTRLTQSTLEGSARLSNVSIASKATVPATPSRPQITQNLAIGGLFGLLLGMLAVLTLESVQRPLRSSADLLEAGGVPVLAVLPPASSTRPQRLIGNTGTSVGTALQLTAD